MRNYKLEYQNYYKDGYFLEKIIDAFYCMAVKQGDLVIDCGANLGMHTFPLSAIVGEKGKVHAIEALPQFAKILTDTTPSNVVVHTTAISDFVGETSFNHVTNCPGLSGIKKRHYYFDVLIEVINVPVTTLDALVPKGAPTFIKLDLEGGEFAALRGARDILERAKPMLIFEHGGSLAAECNGYELMEFHDYLKGFGYHIYNIFGNKREGIHFAENTPWYYVACAQEAHLEIIENAHIALTIATGSYIAQSAKQFAFHN